jgi:YidC/Oxa1 family membrane protein insertase
MVLYAIIRQPLTYLMGITQDQFNTISNMLYGEVLTYKSQQLQMAQDVYLNYDKIVSAIPDLSGMARIDFTFLGMNLSNTPSLMFWKEADILPAFGLWLIPVISAVLSGVSMVVSNKLNAKILGTQKVMDQSTKSMMVMMPLFSLWLCFTLPAALGLYWIANSLFAIISEFLNVPFLKKHMKKLAEDRVKRQAEEKERIIREKKAQAEAKKKAQEEMRRIQMERKLNKSIATASKVGIRAYARGRLYDPERYPTFPYEEPLEIAKRQWAEEEAKKAAQKGKKGKAKTAAPAQEEQTEAKTAAPAEEVVTPAAAPAQAAPAPAEAKTQPEEQEEEGFVEESFLEEEEENQDA